MTRSSALSPLIVALLWTINLSLVHANLNHQDSGTALAAHGSGTAKEMHATAAPIYSTIAKETQTYLEAIAENRGARLSGKAIGPTRLKLIQMGRLGTKASSPASRSCRVPPRCSRLWERCPSKTSKSNCCRR